MDKEQLVRELGKLGVLVEGDKVTKSAILAALQNVDQTATASANPLNMFVANTIKNMKSLGIPKEDLYEYFEANWKNSGMDKACKMYAFQQTKSKLNAP